MCVLQIDKKMATPTRAKQWAKYTTQQFTAEKIPMTNKHLKSCLNSITGNTNY